MKVKGRNARRRQQRMLGLLRLVPVCNSNSGITYGINVCLYDIDYAYTIAQVYVTTSQADFRRLALPVRAVSDAIKPNSTFRIREIK